jgi:hypothetical protein
MVWHPRRLLYPIVDYSVDYGTSESNYGGLDIIGVANVKLSGTLFSLVARSCFDVRAA